VWQRILIFTIGSALFLGWLTLMPSVQGQNKQKEVDRADLRKAAWLRAKLRAEDLYRIFFNADKEPKKVVDFWAAIDFEIQTGKFDIAGYHLEQMLKLPPEEADPDLLTIEEAEGITAFLRLRNVKRWFDNPDLQTEAENNVKTLIDRVSAALEKKLSDPQRLRKFIGYLNGATIEKRTFALAQIKRSREKATPYLVEALQKTAGTFEHHRIMEAMLALDSDIVPPFLEVLRARNPNDAKQADLRLSLLEILKKRIDRRCIPYLWHLSAAPKYPEQVRQRAKELLAFFLEMDVAQLPAAKVALTELANRYMQHQVRFGDPTRVRVWPWTGKQIEPDAVPLKASEAEEFFGLRYAKEALDLDPSYRPAQITYLTLMLERNLNDRIEHLFIPSPKQDVQQPIQSIGQLLKTVDSDLLMVVLDRALADHNQAVALPIIQALGARGETRAAQPGPNGGSGPLIKSLYYPDRRVQFAAATALLNMPGSQAPVASTRVVDVLRRFAGMGVRPKALVAFVNDERGAALRKVLDNAGYDATNVAMLKQAFDRIRESADYDVILIPDALGDYDLSNVLTQLRADADAGTVPILLIASQKRQASLERFTRNRRNVRVLPEAYTVKPADLKLEIETAVKAVMQPDTYFKAPAWQRIWLDRDFKESKLQQLGGERQVFARQSLEALRRMAIGQLTGYDVRRAEPEVLAALRQDDSAPAALEILSRIPGYQAQAHLAEFVLNPKRGVLRVKGAEELNRHIKKNGVSLAADKAIALRALFASPTTDQALRAQLAILVGNLRPTQMQSGQRLLGFDPLAPMPK